MPAYHVICKRGRIRRCGSDLSERHKSELYKRLEAVADAAHKSVAVFEKLVHGIGDRAVSEECRDELSGALGLVSAGESARDNDHLGISYLSFKFRHAVRDPLRGKVVYHEHLGNGSRF